jgi:protocatechuate 4,5-dioxygenase alpha chain
MLHPRGHGVRRVRESREWAELLAGSERGRPTVSGDAGASDAGDLEGTYVFDHRRSRQGYRLNKMCMSLVDPANRDAFLADEAAYMRDYDVPEEQIRAVQSRDWLALVKMGGNIYMLIKVAHLIGGGLYAAGAQQRGETLEEFLETRGARDAR